MGLRVRINGRDLQKDHQHIKGMCYNRTSSSSTRSSSSSSLAYLVFDISLYYLGPTDLGPNSTTWWTCWVLTCTKAWSLSGRVTSLSKESRTWICAYMLTSSIASSFSSGSGIQSKKQFLFGSIEMLIKLVPGNSAGTVTAYYVSSNWAKTLLSLGQKEKKKNSQSDLCLVRTPRIESRLPYI